MARRPTQRQVYEQLLQTHGRLIAEAFAEAIYAARAAVDMQALAAAIDARDYALAGRLLRMDDAALFRVTEATRTAYIAAGQSVTQVLPGAVGVFAFNGNHPRAVEYVRQSAGEMVKNINASPDLLPQLRTVIEDGIQAGRGGDAVARDIVGRVNRATGRREGGFLGLDNPRAHRLDAVRTGMATPEGVRGLVTRGRDGKLRVNYQVNRATEQRILRAYERGEAVSAVDRAISVRQLENNLLKERGAAIARDQAHTAQAMGQREGWQQLIESGKVKEVLKSWQWNEGNQKEAREDHKALSTMPGIPFDRPFTMGDGTQMMMPHDPAGGPKHNAGCHCTVFYRAILPDA